MEERKIKKIIGTGGIGKGLFFLSREEETLGRNESRMAVLSDAKDYCKLHIVFHYLGRFLTPGILVYPIGKVGCDENGRSCKEQMKAAGLNVSWVKESSAHPTMLSICIQYPDKSGGNITADNSACQEVDAEYLTEAARDIGVGPDTIVAALPEVPLEGRLALLRYGKERGAFCVASCGTAEIKEFVRQKGPEVCDLLALNQEETAELAGMMKVRDACDAQEAADRIQKRYPGLNLWLTVGAEGSLLAISKKRAVYGPLPGVKVKNTGGAGDASLAGLLAGYCLGLPWQGEVFSGPDARSAGELATLLGGISVESEDSINLDITPDSVRRRSREIYALKRKEG